MIDLTLLLNPFRDNVVRDAWQNPTDVPSIHDQVFRACLAGIDSATRAIPDSLLIYGPAGSGKTHLLTRLQRHLQTTSEQAPDQVLRCVFVFVRLQTSPRMLWQHVRRRLSTDLMRHDQGVTQLQRLVAHQIGVAYGESPRAGVRRVRILGQEDKEALASHLAEIATKLELPTDLCRVLEHLVCNRWVGDASRWLAGEYLSEEALRQLGLGPDVSDDPEQVAREVVTALCRLAGETLPIVYCFDQVEALQRSADDQDAFFQFGRMAADLHDSDPNVFLITCLQSGVVESFRAAVRSADMDRMAKRRAVLEPLDREQVTGLVRSRLALVPELVEKRSPGEQSPFFPFPATLLDELMDGPAPVARRILAACAHHFEALRGGKLLEQPSVEEFLGHQLESRHKDRLNHLRPVDVNRVVLKGVQVLSAVGDLRVEDRDPEGADLVLLGDKEAAVSLRNEADGRSLGPRLRSLLAHCPRKDGKRLVVVRDSRLTIAKSAPKAREALRELEVRGAVLVNPKVESLAALDALGSLLSDAKSGDLARDGETVGDGAVLHWLRGQLQNPLVEPVRELVDSILSDPPNTEATAFDPDLSELLQREHLLEADQVCRELGIELGRLRAQAQANPDRVLILQGPPTLLLDVAGVAAEREA